MFVTPQLKSKLSALGISEKEQIKKCIARTVLGSSVIRVFEKGTKPDVMKCLEGIDLDRLCRCETQDEYNAFFFEMLERVDRAILKKNNAEGRVGNGHKWGHAAKIACLFAKELVMYSRYFDDATVAKLKPFLYVPIDNVVMQNLKRLGINHCINRINEIDSEKKWWEFQNLLSEAAAEAHVPRVTFDYVWSEERNT